MTVRKIGIAQVGDHKATEPQTFGITTEEMLS